MIITQPNKLNNGNWPTPNEHYWASYRSPEIFSSLILNCNITAAMIIFSFKFAILQFTSS